MISKTFLKAVPALALTLATSAAFSQDVTTVADFELGREFNNITGFWYFVDDAGNGGNSRITSGDTSFKPPIWNSESVGPGNAGSKYAAKLGFTFGTKDNTCGATCSYPPEVSIGTDIRREGDSTLNLTGATKITFFAKAEPAMSILLVYVSADITDYSYFRRPFLIGTEWKEYTVLLSPTTTLAPPNWGQGQAKGKPDFSQAKALNFNISKGSNVSVTSGALYLDDIKFHNWKPPVDPNSIRAQGKSQLTRALKASADGQSLRFSVPAAYREVAGSIAATDLSGKVLAKTSFAKGQVHVILKVGRTAAPVFFRVYAP